MKPLVIIILILSFIIIMLLLINSGKLIKIDDSNKPTTTTTTESTTTTVKTTTTTETTTTTTMVKTTKKLLPKEPGFVCKKFKNISNSLPEISGYIETYYNEKLRLIIFHLLASYPFPMKYTVEIKFIKSKSELFNEKNPYKLNLWQANEFKKFDFDSDGVGNRWIDNDERLILKQSPEPEQPGHIILMSKPVPEQFKSNRIWLFEFTVDNQTERKKIGKLCLTESGDNGKLSLTFDDDNDGSDDDPCEYFPYVTVKPDSIIVNNQYLYMFYSNHVDILTDWHLCNPFDDSNEQKLNCIIHYREIIIGNFFKNHLLIIHPTIGLRNKSTDYFIKIGIESELFKNPYKLNLWQANELKRFDFDSDGVGNRWIDDERLILKQQSEPEQQITLTTKPVPKQFKSNRIWLFEFFDNNQTERTKIGKLCLTESGDNGKLSMIFVDQDCKYFPYVTTIPDCILVNKQYLYMFYSNHVDILTDWHLCNPFDHQNQQQQQKHCIIHYKEIMLEKFFVCNEIM
ncbi:hypothetical protein DERP_012864 [Dermatophagoides pteronyssinus]|uniref:Uncharacterized protein n=1 Tax=Dermatophagoides pteronyssinus TaxID=6956 RepID=A0ABQ8J1L3_DERPT|nr:hypothetical protein DERP_012864 [Dermatophagoides pteronyssinus]